MPVECKVYYTNCYGGISSCICELSHRPVAGDYIEISCFKCKDEPLYKYIKVHDITFKTYEYVICVNNLYYNN